jgi:hypothetical protein
LDEQSTKILEAEICMKVEESLNTSEVKSEIQARIEEGRQNLLDGIVIAQFVGWENHDPTTNQVIYLGNPTHNVTSM